MGREEPHYRVETGRGGKSIHPPNSVSHSLYAYAPYWSEIFVACSIQPSLCLPVNLTATFVAADVHSVQLFFTVMWHHD